MGLLKFCKHTGCPNLVKSGYCELHQADAIAEQEAEKRRKDGHKRGSSTERGYGTRWRKYSKWFLAQEGNQYCHLHLDGCTIFAECVDHIIPPKDASDPLFWDRNNHQAACIHCNSVKGDKTLKGTYDFGD